MNNTFKLLMSTFTLPTVRLTYVSLYHVVKEIATLPGLSTQETPPLWGSFLSGIGALLGGQLLGDGLQT
ncbi:MAG: hypothetical protein LBJ69_01545 [Holosporales bacterium]|nr:hypothetical protein [Holosporales bacterium]